MRSRSLKQTSRKLLPFLCLTILPYLIFSVIGLVLMAKQHKADQIDILWKEAKSREVSIKNFLLKRKTEILFLSQLVSLQNHLTARIPDSLDQNQIQKVFEVFSENGSPYHALYFFNTQHQQEAKILKHKENRTWVRDEKRSLKSITNFFDKALKRKKDNVFVSSIHFHAPYASLPAHYEPIIYLATPVYNTKNQKLGLIVGEISIRATLYNFTRSTSMIKTVPFLASSNGNYMAHAISSKEWGLQLNHQESVTKDFSPHISNQILSGKPGFFEDELEQIGVFLPVFTDQAHLDKYWVIGLVSSAQSFNAYMASYRKEITLFLMMFLLTLVLIWFFYTRYIAAEQKLENTRNEFIAILTHDLRSPLANIYASIQVIPIDVDLTPKLQEVLRRTTLTIKQMTKFINDFLDHSKFEAKKMSLQLKKTSFEPLIQNVVDSFADRTREKNIILKTEISEKLPKLNIDTKMIERSIFNLVDNAIKYSPEHSIINIRADNKRPGSVLFSVTDMGSGIPKDKIAHVFKKYEQLIKTSRTGTGLGLPIVKEVIEAHGGSVGVESKEGKGTTFYFKLRTNQ